MHEGEPMTNIIIIRTLLLILIPAATINCDPLKAASPPSAMRLRYRTRSEEPVGARARPAADAQDAFFGCTTARPSRRTRPTLAPNIATHPRSQGVSKRAWIKNIQAALVGAVDVDRMDEGKEGSLGQEGLSGKGEGGVGARWPRPPNLTSGRAKQRR